MVARGGGSWCPRGGARGGGVLVVVLVEVVARGGSWCPRGGARGGGGSWCPRGVLVVVVARGGGSWCPRGGGGSCIYAANNTDGHT